MNPPQMNGRRRAAARGIWRKEFTRPSRASMSKLRIQRALAKTNGEDIIAPAVPLNFFSGPVFGLTREHVVDLYINGDQNTFYQGNVEYYIQLVCRYVNTQANRAAQGTLPFCITWIDDLWVHFQNPTTITPIMNAFNLTPGNFLNIRHLLIPVLAEALTPLHNNHSWLLSISPLAHTIEIFNSDPSRRPVHPDPNLAVPAGGFITNDDDLIVRACVVLDAFLGRRFVPAKWKIRTGRSPHQGNTPNCGAFTCTTAMHVAFGYSTNYQGIDMENKRLRIASEILNGGFSNHDTFATIRDAESDEFFYPLPQLEWDDEEFIERYPLLEPGFRPMPQTVLNRLVPAMRNRRGRYDDITSKRAMGLLCRGNRRRELRDIAAAWSGTGITLDQWKEAAEIRDEAIRTRQWRPAT